MSVRRARRPATFLDRDGVITRLVPDPRTGRPESPYRVEDVGLIDGAPTALRRLRDAGYRLVVTSNQPAAAKGTVAMEDLDAVHSRASSLLADEGAAPDDWRYCFHHPEGVVERLARACDCRKPEPGLLLQAAADLQIDLGESWMVGDADTDIEAGRSAGCRTALVRNPDSVHRRSGRAQPDVVGDSLVAVAREIARELR